MKLIAKIIDTASGTQLEQSDFDGDDAQTKLDAWKASREAAGEEFGDDKEKKIVVEDVTVQAETQKKILSRAEVREGCMKVIDKISAINTDGNASDEQMDAFFSQPEMIAVILALLTGAPGTAKRKILVVGPAIYPQAVVDDIAADLSALE